MPWKIDITLLDLTGYSSNGAEVFLVDEDRLVVRVSSESESGLYDDFFVEDHRTTLLTSRDAGITWTESDDVLPPPGTDAPDGTRVYIGNQGLSGDALHEHLEREGLGHLYKPDGQMAYRLYKAEKRTELEAQGRRSMTPSKGSSPSTRRSRPVDQPTAVRRGLAPRSKTPREGMRPSQPTRSASSVARSVWTTERLWARYMVA